MAAGIQGKVAAQRSAAPGPLPIDISVAGRTKCGHKLPVSPNGLDRKFQVEAIGGLNQVWSGDITYIPVADSWLYLAVVLDLKSRRVIGWSMAKTLEGALVQDALKMAVSQRLKARPGRNDTPRIFRSDRGSQYATLAFQQQLASTGLIGSMSRKGNCWDNAPTESFFATLT